MLITHAVSITMPQIAFDLQMAGMTCTRRNIGRVSCADFALEPTIPDIGILASTDILAIDQASVDLVYGPPAAEKHDLVERIESRRTLPMHSGWAMTSTDGQ